MAGAGCISPVRTSAHRLCLAPSLPSSADLVSILTIMAGMLIVQGRWHLGKKNGLMRERTRRALDDGDA